MTIVLIFFLILKSQIYLMLNKVYGSAVFVVEAHTITVEVNVDNGIGYHLVGLPDSAIKEVIFVLQQRWKTMAFEFLAKKSSSICRPQICAKRALPMI